MLTFPCPSLQHMMRNEKMWFPSFAMCLWTSRKHGISWMDGLVQRSLRFLVFDWIVGLRPLLVSRWLRGVAVGQGRWLEKWWMCWRPIQGLPKWVLGSTHHRTYIFFAIYHFSGSGVVSQEWWFHARLVHLPLTIFQAVPSNCQIQAVVDWESRRRVAGAWMYWNNYEDILPGSITHLTLPRYYY